MARHKTGFLPIGMVSRITGASARQIDYWTSVGLLKSTDYPEHKRWRGYTFKDTLRIAVIAKLRAEGISLETIKAISTHLARRREDLLSNGKLVAYGTKVFVCPSADTAYDAVSGQTTFLFVDLKKVSDPIKEEFQKAIIEQQVRIMAIGVVSAKKHISM